MALLKTKSPQLDAERVRGLQEEINAYIDQRAAALKAETPGVPLGVCRNLLTVRSGGCECRAFLRLEAESEQ
jgi:hypothetical protein